MTTMSLKPQFSASPTRTPPTLGRFPFGVLPEFRRDPLGLYGRAMLQHRDLVRMRFGPRFSYTVYHPDFIKRILVDNNKNFQRHELGNGLLKRLIGENLLTSDGEFWLRQRRLLQPAFHRQRIHGLGGIMTDSATQMLQRWDQVPADQEIDLAREMMQVTLRVVGRALFSVDLLQDSSGLGRSIEMGSRYFAYRLGRLFAPPLWVPTKINREYKAAVQSVLHIVPDMISARRQFIAQHGTADEGERQFDMIDLLLAARYEDTDEGMDDEQLATEIRMFIAAGHETTSNTLTWTLYLLSQHPDVEAKLHREVDETLSGRLPTTDDLARLPYAKMVLEEAMRLYPAAWVLARQSIGEDQFGEYVIPPHHGVVVPIFAVHRHPDYWPEPERFDPERFTAEQAAQTHRFAYLPFGGGPRQCIGSAFALTEAQLILAMITQRYQPRVRPGYQVEPEAQITLKVRGGLPVRLVRRWA
jgi:cytochrome P450